MFLTRLGIVPLPEPYGRLLEHARFYDLTYSQAQEVAAVLKTGSSEMTAEALDALRQANRYENGCHVILRELLIARGAPNLSMKKDDDLLTIECNDGSVIEVSTSLLRRRFQFFDDYLAQFPGERRVRLDFDEPKVRSSIYSSTKFKLVDHLDCINFLNPKSPLYVFQYDTVDTPSEIILQFAHSVAKRTGDRYSMVISHQEEVLVMPSSILYSMLRSITRI